MTTKITAILMTAALLSACAADAGSGGEKLTDPAAEGGFTAQVDGKTHSIDYTGFMADVVMTHRTNPTGPACVPNVKLSVAGPGGECKLELEFEADFDGALVLKDAKFHAKAAIYQDDFPIDSIACPGWADESKYAKGHKPALYTYASGVASLNMKPLQQPEAAKDSAILKDMLLQPTGEISMAFKGRKFKLDLSGIKFVGDAKSEGGTNVTCAQTHEPLPYYELEDINAKSPYNGEKYSLERFKGKYVVVLMGAGWCASCVSQTEYMQKIKADLESQGRDDVAMVTINDSSADNTKDRKTMCGKKGEATFTVFQGTGKSGETWSLHVDPDGKTGKKNDAFIYAPNGKFIFKHIGKGTVMLNQFESEVRAALNNKDWKE